MSKQEYSIVKFDSTTDSKTSLLQKIQEQGNLGFCFRDKIVQTPEITLLIFSRDTKKVVREKPYVRPDEEIKIRVRDAVLYYDKFGSKPVIGIAAVQSISGAFYVVFPTEEKPMLCQLDELVFLYRVD